MMKMKQMANVVTTVLGALVKMKGLRKKMGDNFVEFLVVVAFSFGLCFLLLYLFGCDEQQCIDEEMRCNGSVLETCDSDGQWEEFGDCAGIENIDGSPGRWVCCEAELFCVPERECE